MGAGDGNSTRATDPSAEFPALLADVESRTDEGTVTPVDSVPTPPGSDEPLDGMALPQTAGPEGPIADSTTNTGALQTALATEHQAAGPAGNPAHAGSDDPSKQGPRPAALSYPANSPQLTNERPGSQTVTGSGAQGNASPTASTPKPDSVNPAHTSPMPLRAQFGDIKPMPEPADVRTPAPRILTSLDTDLAEHVRDPRMPRPTPTPMGPTHSASTTMTGAQEQSTGTPGTASSIRADRQADVLSRPVPGNETTDLAAARLAAQQDGAPGVYGASTRPVNTMAVAFGPQTAPEHPALQHLGPQQGQLQANDLANPTVASTATRPTAAAPQGAVNPDDDKNIIKNQKVIEFLRRDFSNPSGGSSQPGRAQADAWELAAPPRAAIPVGPAVATLRAVSTTSNASSSVRERGPLPISLTLESIATPISSEPARDGGHPSVTELAARQPTPELTQSTLARHNATHVQELHEQFMRFTLRHAAQNGRFALQLQPQQLGVLDVEFTAERGELNVAIVARESATKEALEATLPRLRAALTDAGLNLGQVDVRHQREETQRHAESAQGSQPDREVAGEGEEAAQRRPSGSQTNTLDLYI
jgi:flagellar hook-length control protein FliK